MELIIEFDYAVNRDIVMENGYKSSRFENVRITRSLSFEYWKH